MHLSEALDDYAAKLTSLDDSAPLTLSSIRELLTLRDFSRPSRHLLTCLMVALLSLCIVRPVAAQIPDATAIAERVAEGDRLFYESRYDAAQDIYAALVDQVGPETPAAALPLAHRCWLYNTLQFYDAALADCEAAAQLDPELADAQIYLIRVYNWSGQSERAFTAANRALELAPNNPLALALLAEAYFDAANINQARTTIDQAIAALTASTPAALTPADSAIYRNQALILQDEAQPERYEQAMRQAIAIAPNFAPLYDEFSFYFQNDAQFGPLIEQLTALVNIFTAAGDTDRQIEYLTLLADYTFLIGDYVNSLPQYQQLYALNTDQGNIDEAAGSLGRVGLLQLWMGDLASAKVTIQQALAIGASNESIRAELLLNLARIERQQGDNSNAEAALQQALTLIENVDDPVNHLTILNELGSITLDRGNTAAAIAYHEQALALSRTASYMQGVVVSLSYLAVAYSGQGAYPVAETTFLEALELAQSLKLSNDEANVRLGLGRVYRILGRFNEAYEQLEAAYTLLQTIDNLNSRANTLAELSLVRTSQAQFADAEQYANAAYELYLSLDDQSGQATALTNLGLVQYKRAQFEDARANYLAALELLGNDTAASLNGAVLNNLGAVADALGSFNEALDYFQQSLDQARVSGNLAGESAALSNMGVLYHKQGLLQDSLSANQEALSLAETTGNPVAQAAILVNIGRLYSDLGNYTLADENYQRGLALQQIAGDRGGEATTLVSIASLQQLRSQTDDALATYQQTLAIHRELGLTSNEIIILNNIGMIYYGNGDLQEATNYLNEALEIARAMGDLRQEAVLLENLAGIDLSFSDPDAALEKLQQALALNTELQSLSGMASTEISIAWAYETKNDIPQAIEHYKTAISLREQQLNNLNVDELKSSFASLQIDEYARLVVLLLGQNRVDEAFDTMERARARVLVEQLASRAVNFRQSTDSTLLDQEKTLRDAISARRDQLLALRNRPRADWDATAIQSTQVALTQLESDYGNLVTQLEVQSPEATSLVTVDVAALNEVQQLLPPQTTLVEYFLTHSQNVALVITRDRVEAVEIPATQTEIADAVISFRDFVTLDDPHPDSLQKLYGWLIDPIANLITTANVAIVPHGILHYLPFAALTDGATYFGEQYATYTLPSASVLRYLQPKEEGPNPTLLALGNPTIDAPLAELPFAAEEAEAVAELYASTPLIGTSATESAVRQQASQATILHLAAHGELNAVNPLFSTLYLAADNANDGRLEVHEIYGLDLTSRTDLVVLSACQTSLGDLSAGDEVVGLNRAFLYAGTPSVMASLWNIDDAATVQLMEAFYQHLRAGMGKAEALAAAQSDVRAIYPHPYYWASFVLTGDGGEATQLASQIAGSEVTTTTLSDASLPATTAQEPDEPNNFILWAIAALVILVIGASAILLYRQSKQ